MNVNSARTDTGIACQTFYTPRLNNKTTTQTPQKRKQQSEDNNTIPKQQHVLSTTTTTPTKNACLSAHSLFYNNAFPRDSQLTQFECKRLFDLKQTPKLKLKTNKNTFNTIRGYNRKQLTFNYVNNYSLNNNKSKQTIGLKISIESEENNNNNNDNYDDINDENRRPLQTQQQSSNDIRNYFPKTQQSQQNVFNNVLVTNKQQINESTNNDNNNNNDLIINENEYNNNITTNSVIKQQLQPIGLTNLGNTCFMNAIFQCLYNLKDFSNFFKQNTFDFNKTSKFGTNGEIALSLSQLFKEMSSSLPHYGLSIAPKQFKSSVIKHLSGFSMDYDQQDSHEFLVLLLEKLHEDLNINDCNINDDNNCVEQYSDVNTFWTKHKQTNNSIISSLFEGLLINELQCNQCKHQSITFELFTSISLPLSDDESTLQSLDTCLDHFLKPEQLSGDACWHCQQCKQKREAIKTVSIHKLPKVLLIHLKRFSYVSQLFREKLSTFVDFDVNSLIINSTKYSLNGVINHYGTLECGHYTAYSLSSLDNRWYKYDDSDVKPINQIEDVVTRDAYILFYVKCVQ